MDKPEIFAVIWCDFIPLSLHCDSAETAIEKAKDIFARAGDKVSHVRAVHVPAGVDKLITLWGAEP